MHLEFVWGPHSQAGAEHEARLGMMPIAVTMGDPAGIGLEITCQAWRERHRRGLPPFFLIADADAVGARARDCGRDVPIGMIERPAQAIAAFKEQLPIWPVTLQARAQAGHPNIANADAVIAAITRATAAVVQGEAAAIVTNPIAKSVLHAAGFAHPGHTEFLGVLAEHHAPGQRYRPVMMLACPILRVVPLTIHIPLSQVPSALSPALIEETVRIMAAALTADFGIAMPRIAVAGLNPHAGEAGSMGREDSDLIAPAVARLRAEGILVSGPHPADTLFHTEARRGYDAVLAMYHDQALIPIKTLAFDSAVNVTLGLPFVRTSPDHGTAFDIAGRGVASCESLIAALMLAADMAARRAGAQ